MCQNYKCETGCKFARPCFFRHVEAEEKPSKKSKKSGSKGPVSFLKESTQLGCVPQDSYPSKSILCEEGHLGSKHAVSKGTWHLLEIRERKGPSIRIIQKCAPHERSPYTIRWNITWRDLATSKMRPQSSMGKLKNADKDTFYTSKSPEEREFGVDSGASMHLIILAFFLTSLQNNLQKNGWCWTNEKDGSNRHAWNSLWSNVSKLVFCVNIFGFQIDSVEQPIKSNSVGSGHVSHCWTSSFDNHFDDSFTVFNSVQLRLTVRRMCVGEHIIHITQLINLLFYFDFLGLGLGFCLAQVSLMLSWIGLTVLIVERNTSITDVLYSHWAMAMPAPTSKSPEEREVGVDSVARKSERHRIACTRTQFSGIRFGTSYESGNKNQGSIVFIYTHFQNIEIGMSAWEPK